MQHTYATWHSDPGKDIAMQAGHEPYWRHFIAAIRETDLATSSVLDFGCNRGGFLRLLHALRPFCDAVGVDIAADSVAAARALAPGLPIDYRVATDLFAWPQRFDLAFSYEVIYLLPDIAEHARQIHAALRPGGVYYATTGCHTHCPLWPAWRELIATTTNAPVQDRAPDDYAAAFAAAGFAVSACAFGMTGYLPVSADSRYFPRLADALDYANRHKLIFRCAKPPRELSPAEQEARPAP